MREKSTKILLSGLAIAAFSLPAHAQSPIRIDARIHSSAGSCSQFVQ